MTTPGKIRSALASRSPELVSESHSKHAAVAMLLKPGRTGIDMLFIRRSEHRSDPWSGNLAFPGGKIDQEDSTPLQAAMRETKEEIGVDLERAELAGRLDDIAGAYLPVTVSCFVFLLPGSASETVLNHEVRETFWFPLEELGNPERHHTGRVDWHGAVRRVAGIDLLGDRGPVLWGITYRLVMQFLELINGAPGERRGQTSGIARSQ